MRHSLAMPTARFDRELLPTWVGAMSAIVARIENDLAGEAGADTAAPAGAPEADR